MRRIADIGKLKPGAEATVYLRDSLAGLPARITVVNRIATQLKDTPLLQHYGGQYRFISPTAATRVTLQFFRCTGSSWSSPLPPTLLPGAL